MSKAFTRESDDAPEIPVVKPSAGLPPGVKNYFTPQGVPTLRRKLEQLSAEAISPATRQLIYEIQQSLQTAVVVEPPPPPWHEVLFGAIVTVLNQHAELLTYRIVGMHETDLAPNNVSWRSPVGKALLKAKVGEQVSFHAPEGDQTWEITHVRYEP